MRVLLSGFTPFGKYRLNPSWEAVRRLDGLHTGNGVTLFSTRLPVVYEQAADRLISAMHVIRPDVVIGVGLADKREQITIERVAINLIDSFTPDNEGSVLSDASIINGGPAAYFSTLPVREIINAIKETGTPAVLSNTAGTFVCNNVFYRLMHELEDYGGSISGGFIHVPLIPELITDALQKGVDLEKITDAIKEAALVSVRYVNKKKNI